MNTLVQNLRFALRQMRRSPGFAMTAVPILALWIAANVIVFGVLQAMILRPLDVPNPDRVMTFAPRVAGYPIFSYSEVRDVRDGNTVSCAVAPLNIDVLGPGSQWRNPPGLGIRSERQYFEVVAIKPYLGRLLERAR